MAKAASLIWLEEAVRDLERLRDFLAQYDPRAARRAGQRIRKAVSILRRFPEAGRPLENPSGFRDLIAPFGVGGYVIRYRIVDGGVVIVRVWHSREVRH